MSQVHLVFCAAHAREEKAQKQSPSAQRGGVCPKRRPQREGAGPAARKQERRGDKAREEKARSRKRCARAGGKSREAGVARGRAESERDLGEMPTTEGRQICLPNGEG